jgi:hypothetical protein
MSVGVIGVLLLSVCAVCSQTAGDESDGYGELQRKYAAVNYELAASTLKDESERLLADGDGSGAAGSRERGAVESAKLSADRQMRAAGLAIRAAQNFDKAAKCWAMAAAMTGDGTDRDAADTATRNATIAYQDAAVIFENAARSFATAGLPLNEAAANEKAAGLRELLAGRE